MFRQNWTTNIGSKLLAVLFAVVFWFSVTNELEFETTLVLPIEYDNQPPEITPLRKLPTEVEVRVRGKGKFLRLQLRDAECRVDLTGSKSGSNVLRITGGNLKLPTEVEVRTKEVIGPEWIQAKFDTTVIRDVPVFPNVLGAPAPKYKQVGKTFVNPAVARVKGPRSIVDDIGLVSTEEVNIEGNRNPHRKRVRLVRPGPETVEVTPMTVEVGITIEPVETKRIDNIVLEFADMPEELTGIFQPALIQVEITGARSIVEASAKEASTIHMSTEEWTLGTSILRFKEVRGRDIVYAPYESFPLTTVEPWNSATSPPAIGPTGPPGNKVPAAVRGEIVGSLAIAPDLDVAKVEPARIVVKIREKKNEPELVHSPNPAP